MISENNEKPRKGILGIGLDAKDGHARITRVDDVHLVGGSEETHGVMQEKAIKFNEELKKRGKSLQETSDEETLEIADKVEMPLRQPPNKKPNP